MLSGPRDAMSDSLLNGFAEPKLRPHDEDRKADADTDRADVRPAPSPPLSSKSENAMRLLHALGYLYGRHGQTKRALVLQLMAARLAPNDAAILRSLAYTFLMDGAPDRALAVIERLRGMEDGDHPALDLLRSRALWESGNEIEARRVFRDFIERRRQP
jgi:type III secretion protein Y